MNSHLSYCGSVDPRISASDKDLPVQMTKQENEHRYNSKCFGSMTILLLIFRPSIMLFILVRWLNLRKIFHSLKKCSDK